MRKYTITLGTIVLILLNSCRTVEKTVYSENFTQSQLTKEWNILTKEWTVSDGILYGNGTQPDWSILLNKKELPKDYILEFSSWIETDERLLEVILNLHEVKFVGLLMNYLEESVELEDRNLYDKEGNPDIRTLENIGKFPEVTYPKKFSWNEWKIQKVGNQLFVWINGEEIVKLDGAINILKDGGQFGFATSGKVKIKDIQLKTSKLPAPKNFVGKTDTNNFFLFGE